MERIAFRDKDEEALYGTAAFKKNRKDTIA